MSHVNPDGDGLGSSLALKTILSHLGLTATIVVDQGDLSRYEFLSCRSNTLVFTQDQIYQTLIILDCNNESRLGNRNVLISKAKQVLIIDHHEYEDGIIPNVFNYISTSEVCVGTILYSVFKDDIHGFDLQSRKYVADCLYTSIINDTNNFTNINTNQDVLNIASELCQLGLNPAAIYTAFFSDHDPWKLKLIGEVIATMELLCQNRILIIHSTLDMIERNFQPIEALDNMTKWVQGLRGVDVILYLKETGTEVFKVSLRSPTIDVNCFASAYGGGGHKTAAGMTMRGALSQIRQHLIIELERILGC
ncbi:MAG: DHH family phosphoesterase [Candidatus Cloacimonetes bacterium]|nr:DHH family phosphoesterase [Candidatus Cloacimonadota bacterium]